MKKYSNIIICTLISLYFALAITWDYTGILNGINFLFNFSLVFVICEIISLFIWNKFNFNLFQKKQKEISWKEFIIYFFIMIIPIGFMIYSYYPALGHPDTFQLWNELKNWGIISNWHPIIYQFIFIYLPQKIWNNIYSTMIIQILVEVSVLLYMCFFFRKNFLNFKQTIILLLMLVLNPLFLKYSVYVVKDVPFACFVLLSTLHLINIVKSEGKWLNKNVNKVFFLISTIGILATRHNGLIPFVGTFILLFILFAKLRKFVFISFSTIMIAYFILTGPICRKLDIGKSGGRIEMIGVVLNNLSYYYNNDAMNEEDKKVVLELHHENVWRERYGWNPRNFNLIKNYEPGISECEEFPKYCSDDDGTGMAFGDRLDSNFNDILKTWANISLRNPNLFLKAYLNATSPIWEMKKEISGFNYYWDAEIEVSGTNLKFHDAFEAYHKFVTKTPFRIIGIGFGEGLFIIILSIFIIMRKFRFDLKKLLPFVPVILNTASVMLLITGEEHRFVFTQILCALPILIYALSLNNKISKIKINKR